MTDRVGSATSFVLGMDAPLLVIVVTVATLRRVGAGETRVVVGPDASWAQVMALID